MNLDGLTDNISHRHARVEAADGVLKNDLEVAAHGAQFPGRDGEKILALIAVRAGGGRDQTENGPPHRGFAAAGFADKPKCFAGLHIEADIIDGLYISNGSGKDAALDGEP